MSNNKIKALLFGGVLVFGAGISFEAAARSVAHMPTGGRTSQPIGHSVFCKQYSSECSVRTNNTRPTKLTRKRWKQIIEVNNQINLAVEPVTDLEYYKKEEHWTYPKRFGDCEDYVLLKRYMLMQDGWPASSLLITVVRQPNGDGHAVLTVRTDRADYVLDNLKMEVKQWNKTEYTYLKRQSTNHSGRWTKIKHRR